MKWVPMVYEDCAFMNQKSNEFGSLGFKVYENELFRRMPDRDSYQMYVLVKLRECGLELH